MYYSQERECKSAPRDQTNILQASYNSTEFFAVTTRGLLGQLRKERGGMSTFNFSFKGKVKKFLRGFFSATRFLFGGYNYKKLHCKVKQYKDFLFNSRS